MTHYDPDGLGPLPDVSTEHYKRQLADLAERRAASREARAAEQSQWEEAVARCKAIDEQRFPAPVELHFSADRWARLLDAFGTSDELEIEP